MSSHKEEADEIIISNYTNNRNKLLQVTVGEKYGL